jgi:hypothetical protein
MYAWNEFGVRDGYDGQHPYWQVTLDRAGKWFPDNRIDLPDIWFDDRKGANPPARPEPEQPRLARSATIPAASSLPAPSSQPVDRVPSVDQLVDVHQALWWFHQQMGAHKGDIPGAHKGDIPNIGGRTKHKGDIPKAQRGHTEYCDRAGYSVI